MNCNKTSLCYLLNCRSGDLVTQETLLQTVVGKPVCDIQHNITLTISRRPLVVTYICSARVNKDMTH